MDDREHLAAQYRRQAAACQEVAEQMSLRADRDKMLTMAKQWLELAEEVRERGSRFGVRRRSGFGANEDASAMDDLISVLRRRRRLSAQKS
jgi:hypothetical protein